MYENIDTRLEIKRGRTACKYCGNQLHEHEKTRVRPDDFNGWHYRYECPETGFAPAIET